MCLLFTAKGQGPPPHPPTSGPGEADSPLAPTRHPIGPVYLTINSVFVVGWNTKCGYWTSDPYNDYCYLFNYLSMRTWAEARADCVNQGGDLISITDPFEQAFIQGGTILPMRFFFKA